MLLPRVRDFELGSGVRRFELLVRLRGMRGDERVQDGMFSYVSLDQRVPAEHPLREVRKVAAALADRTARPSRAFPSRTFSKNCESTAQFCTSTRSFIRTQPNVAPIDDAVPDVPTNPAPRQQSSRAHPFE
jgi:hypothetical protein